MNRALHFVIILFFSSCSYDLYPPEFYLEASRKMYAGNSIYVNSLVVLDSVRVEDTYIKEKDVIIQDYVHFKISNHEQNNATVFNINPLYYSSLNEVQRNSLNRLKSALDKLSLKISLSEEGINKADEKYKYNYYFHSKFIDEAEIIDYAGEEMDNYVLVPFISTREEGFYYDPAISFRYTTCSYLGIFILYNKKIVYSKSGYICKVSKIQESNYEKETELTQAEWDLLVYELMREYLERLE